MRFPAGSQCWVETRQPDPVRASEFYGALFGWQVRGAVATLGGRPVASIAEADAATWITRVRVRDLEAAAGFVRSAGGSVLAAAEDAVPSGRVALVRDPGGASLGLWETGDAAPLVNEPGSWDLSALHAPDAAQAVAFYGAVFGWRAEPLGATTLWRLDGYSGGVPGQPVPRDVVGIMAPPAQDPGAWVVDFRVHSVDATVDAAIGLGAAVLERPHDAGPFRTADLADPQGAVFSVTAFQ